MKKSILKKALLGLVAIVGFSFVDGPTVVVNPTSGEVEPGYRYALTLTYTNTDVMRMRVVQFPYEADMTVPIPDGSRNLPTESNWYIFDIIPDPNTIRTYQFVVYGPIDDNGERLMDRCAAIISTNNVQPM